MVSLANEDCPAKRAIPELRECRESPEPKAREDSMECPVLGDRPDRRDLRVRKAFPE